MKVELNRPESYLNTCTVTYDIPNINNFTQITFIFAHKIIFAKKRQRKIYFENRGLSPYYKTNRPGSAPGYLHMRKNYNILDAKHRFSNSFTKEEISYKIVLDTFFFDELLLHYFSPLQ
jgi:hypothetical protein